MFTNVRWPKAPGQALGPRRPWLPWVLVVVWSTATVLHHVASPFPPWAATMDGVALMALFLSYGLGLCLHGASLLPHALRRWCQAGAQASFLVGGAVVMALVNKPEMVASLWILFALVRVLHRHRGVTPSSMGSGRTVLARRVDHGT